MNQKERMKAYEQQRQRAEELKKGQRIKTKKKNNSRKKVNQSNTKQSERKVASTSQATKRQASSIAETKTIVETKKGTKPSQTSTVKKQGAPVRSQTVQSGQVRTTSARTSTKVSAAASSSSSRTAAKASTSTSATRRTSSTTRRLAYEATTRRKETLKRTQMREPLRAKKGPKAKGMSISEFVQKVSQVSKEIKEGIQGAVYYIGTTLEQAKEREEREEREETIDTPVQNITSVQRGNERIQKAPSSPVVSNRVVSNQKVQSMPQEKYDSKKYGLKEWCRYFIQERRMETITTACVAFLVVVIGGSMISGLGHSGNDSGDDNNPIRNLINMMDFVNIGNKEDKDETKESLDSNFDSSNGSSQTGITGNYSIRTASGKIVDISRILCPSWIDRQFLTVNEYSRPGDVLDSIQSIVIHYVGNPGTTAQNNRNYFENLKNTHESKKSSHFVVGLEGEVIQCIPLNEKSYASNHRNPDTISIEVCHPAEDGKFSDVTYEAVVKLTAWLCQNFELTDENIIRHYDVTEKHCPKYFVDHPDEWETFKEDVMNYMEQNPDIQ